MSDSPYASRIYNSGDVIFKEGEFGSKAFLLKSGSVNVIKQAEKGGEEVIASYGKGSIVGEMALIDDAPRAATLMARETCEVLIIDKDELQGRLEKSDPVINRILATLSTRLRSQAKTIAELKKNQLRLND